MPPFSIPPSSLLLPLILAVGFAPPAIGATCTGHSCKVSEACSSDGDCEEGLYCGNCPAMGKNQPTCTREKATIPTTIVKGLPFNRYSWLMTHNSFSIKGELSHTGRPRITFYNQEDSVTNQLKNGVRGLMLDMYDFKNDIWLCHSHGGKCFDFTAFELAIDTLKEVETFLTQNPSDIITIIIEDYVRSSKGLTKLFTKADLMKYWFPISMMPKNGTDWPTITDMIAKNHRLLVFTSNETKEAYEGIAYQWKYLLENEPGSPGLVKGSCQSRKESSPLYSRAASLILMDYFPTYPNSSNACKDHSSSLSEMVDTCYKAAGNVMPNFLAVNYYKRSDGGGVFDILDRMNGQTLGGHYAMINNQANSSFGNVAEGSAGSLQYSSISSSFFSSVLSLLLLTILQLYLVYH